MSAVVAALIPVFAVILLGWGLRRSGFPGDALWAPLERLVYFVLFPALLVGTLARTELGAVLDPAPLLALAAAVSLMGFAVILVAPRLHVDGPRVGAVFQGTVRFNTYVFLAAVAALFGPEGLALGAVCVAFLVPLINVYCVGTLIRFGEGASAARWGVALARNPLILGCAAGIALSGLDLELPGPLAELLDILGRAALPLGLLAVGAALDLERVRAGQRTVAVTTALKLLALPALGYALCAALGVEGLVRDVAVLWCAMPTAASSYILARQLGGDASLTAGVVTASHLAAFVTVPAVVGVLVR